MILRPPEVNMICMSIFSNKEDFTSTSKIAMASEVTLKCCCMVCFVVYIGSLKNITPVVIYSVEDVSASSDVMVNGSIAE